MKPVPISRPLTFVADAEAAFGGPIVAAGAAAVAKGATGTRTRAI